MSAVERPVGVLVAQAGAVAEELGVAVGPRVSALRAFVAGPFVIAVAGLPKSGRSRVAAGLSAVRAGVHVEEQDVRSAGPLGLWDALVVVTPADRALSHAEEALVKAARAARRLVVVVVSRADMLGAGDARAAAQAEIERFRLRPALGPLGVRWFFSGLGDPLAPVGEHLASTLPPAPEPAHWRAVLDGLASVVNHVAGQLDERVATRERELAALRELEALAPLALTHCHEVIRLARLSVRDAVRVADERVVTAAGATVDAAITWVARAGRGDLHDVEQPLREAWRSLVEGSPRICDAPRLHVVRELDRLALRMANTATALGLSQRPSFDLPHAWTSRALEDAARRLAEADISPVFQALEEELRSALKPSEDEPDEPRTSVTRRIASSLSRFKDGPFDERLRALALGHLDALARSRIDALLEAASAAADEGARRDVKLAMDAARGFLDAVRASLTARYAWGAAYGELLELRSQVEEARRHHGV